MQRVRVLAGWQLSDDEWIRSILEDLPPADIFTKQVELLTDLQSSDHGLADLKKKYPQLWINLCSEADIDVSSSFADQCEHVEAYLAKQYGSLDQWVTVTLLSSQKLLKIVNAASIIRAALAMPNQCDLLSRYQAALDNEWFKGLRALREAQKFRLEQAARNASPIARDGN